jgi:elongation factor G
VGEEFVGPVIANLGRRRGIVKAMRVRGAARSIEGEVPLAETFGYATDLRSMTSGRGTFTLEFDRYDQVPDSIAKEVVERRHKEGKVPKR